MELFMANVLARVSKSRYTLAGALLSTAVGVVMSVLLAYLM